MLPVGTRGGGGAALGRKCRGGKAQGCIAADEMLQVGLTAPLGLAGGFPVARTARCSGARGRAAAARARGVVGSGARGAATAAVCVGGCRCCAAAAPRRGARRVQTHTRVARRRISFVSPRYPARRTASNMGRVGGGGAGPLPRVGPALSRAPSGARLRPRRRGARARSAWGGKQGCDGLFLTSPPAAASAAGRASAPARRAASPWRTAAPTARRSTWRCVGRGATGHVHFTSKRRR